MTGLVGAIALPDGTAVRGRGRREPVPAGPLPEFGLYLGKPGQWQPAWAAEWIDWPDFRTPRDAHEAAAKTVAARISPARLRIGTRGLCRVRRPVVGNDGMKIAAVRTAQDRSGRSAANQRTHRRCPGVSTAWRR